MAGLSELVKDYGCNRDDGLVWLKSSVEVWCRHESLTADQRLEKIQGALAEFKLCFPDKEAA